MISKALLALAIFAAVACGKYGPPVRSAPEQSTASPAVSASPAAGDTEECADPKAPAQAAGTTP